MGLFRWMFATRPHRRGVLAGDDEFGFHVVGTSHHQAVLEQICGGRTRAGVHRYCAALLTPQPSNPYDRHAVAVMVYDVEVGFLDRADARDFGRVLRGEGFTDAACEALIVGGWDRGGHDRGYFGVRLNACLPLQIYPAEEWGRRGR
jgi:hypothetical protein